MKETITFVILTKNEESRIRRCISSINIPSKVIVLDSFSDDQTIYEAQKTWKDCEHSPSELVTLARTWRGFTDARNASLNWVTTDWVFWIDADEWLSNELNDELSEWLVSQKKNIVGRIPRQSFFLGRAIRHGGWFPDYKRRLVRREEAHWSRGPNNSDVHEDLSLDKPTHNFKACLFHESFRSVAEQEESNDRYSTLLAEGLARKLTEQKKKAPGKSYVTIKIVIKFLENYILKLGFLDGRPGFLIAKGSAKSLKSRLEKTARLMAREHLS